MATGGPRSSPHSPTPACCWSRSAPSRSRPSTASGSRPKWRAGRWFGWPRSASPSTASPRCCSCVAGTAISIFAAPICTWRRTPASPPAWLLRRLLIMLTGWLWVDPAISLVIAAVVAASGWGLARDSVNLALDGVPRGIALAEVRDYLGQLDGVTEVHDLHVWAMSTNETALTAHLVRPGGSATIHSCTTSARSFRAASTSTTPRCRSRRRAMSASWRRRRWCNAGVRRVGQRANPPFVPSGKDRVGTSSRALPTLQVAFTIQITPASRNSTPAAHEPASTHQHARC